MESGSVFDPNSPLAKPISDVFTIVLLLGLGVFLLIAGLVTFAIIRYRRRPGDDTEPIQSAGNFRLEVAWTAGPLLLGIGLMVLTFTTMGASDPAKPTGQEVDLEVIGHQWWWEYRYLKDNVVTANELHIPVGQRLYVRFKSSDVIHGWWVPQLGRQMQINPDHVNYTWLQSDKAGLFYGACTQYCGGPHAWMLLQVIAQPQDQYDQWLQQQKQAGQSVATEAPGDPAKGQQVFLNNTCVNCHAIAGTTANAQVGPNLTHFGARKTFGAGVSTNTPENLTKWIKNPQAVKPGVLMPGYQFNDEDMRNLVAYLESLK